MAAALLLAGSREALGRGKDRIIKADGTVLREVEIDKERHDSVTIRVKGGPKTDEPAHLIAEIVHEDQPAIYGKGEGARLAGQYQQAIEAYGKAKELAEPKWVKPWASYWLAESYRAAGEGDAAMLGKAVEEFQAVLKEHPDHFVVPRAQYGVGDCYRRQEQYASAVEAFEKLATGPYGDRWQIMGLYGKASSYLGQGDNQRAREDFSKVADRAGDNASFADVKILANLGAGQALINEKRPQDAIKHFQSLAERAGEGESVIAGAYVGLGESWLALGDSPENKRNALMAFLKVVVLFPRAAEPYARSLYEAARLYEALGEGEKAAALKGELKVRCPQSKWARMIG